MNGNKVLKLIFLILLVCIPAQMAIAGEFSFDYQKIIELNQPVEFDLSLFTGNITINGTADDRIIIDAVKTIRASNRDEAEEVADHIEIKVVTTDGKVEVNTNYLTMRNRNKSFWDKFLGTTDEDAYGQVDYMISVPTETAIKLRCMESIIQIASVEGTVDIENNTGITRAEYIFGDITLSQPFGNIDLQWIEGDIRVKSNSSEIKISQLRGALDIANLTGKVEIQTELDSPRDYFVETSTGSITFIVPVTSSGELNIQAKAGEIKSDIPVLIKSVSRHQLIGQFGNGGPKVNIISSTGDVDIKQF